MPEYDYRCDDCGTLWSAFRSIDTRRATILCPECKGHGHLVITTAPHLAWYPGAPRKNFHEKLREGI